jgi:hypothetical protein
MKWVTQVRSSGVWRTAAAPIGVCLLLAVAVSSYSLSTPAGAAAVNGTGSHPAQLAATKTACPTGTAPGATATQVTAAVTVVDITGSSLSNATVGVPSPQQQEQYWNLVAKNINSHGGAGCRKLALKFYNVNPIDAAGAQQSCLTIAASKPFAVLDEGALSDVNASSCIAQAKIPMISTYFTPDELTKYYPYYLSATDVPTETIRTSVLGLAKSGYYSAAKGFKKLGVLYDTCSQGLVQAERSALKEAGVPSSKIVWFNLGCPAGQVFTPAAMEQAVLSFKNAGVTNVADAQAGAAPNVFTQVAAQQKYKPKYTLNNSEIIVGGFSGADAANPGNLNGGVNAVTQAYGEQTTPGYKATSGTAKCNAIFAAAKLPNVYKQADGYGGVACDYLWYLQGLLNHSTSLQSSKLVTAVHKIGSLQYSYPYAPVNYAAAPKGAPYGVSYWRIATYVASCQCWHIPNPTWNAPQK